MVADLPHKHWGIIKPCPISTLKMTHFIFMPSMHLKIGVYLPVYLQVTKE